MWTFVKTAVRDIGLKGYGLMAVVALVAVLGTKGYSTYTSLKSDVASYQKKASDAENDKVFLQSEATAQKNRADSAEQNASLLSKQLEDQQKLDSQYHAQLAALEAQREKQNNESKQTIQRLNLELARAGVRDNPVPVAVIRMQQQTVCRVNGTCASGDSHEN